MASSVSTGAVAEAARFDSFAVVDSAVRAESAGRIVKQANASAAMIKSHLSRCTPEKRSRAFCNTVELNCTWGQVSLARWSQQKWYSPVELTVGPDRLEFTHPHRQHIDSTALIFVWAQGFGRASLHPSCSTRSSSSVNCLAALRFTFSHFFLHANQLLGNL